MKGKEQMPDREGESRPGYDRSRVQDFYNRYGRREWERWEDDAHARLMFRLHLDLLDRLIRPGLMALDAGCGPGRYAVEMAARGASVELVDVADGQLALARQALGRTGHGNRLIASHQADIVDLSFLPSNRFDVTVCFGGALSYTVERRLDAARELVRVTKPGGWVAVSVDGLLGALRELVAQGDREFFAGVEAYHLWPVLEGGDRPYVPVDWNPAMHLFRADELRRLLTDAGAEVVEMGAANAVASELHDGLSRIAEDEAAWAALVEMERRASREPGLLDTGRFIMALARRP